MSPLDRIDWLASIAGDRSLPPSALAVAVVVAKFTNAKTGDARPSKETIAKMVGTDERAVRRMVRALEDRGWMKAVHTKGRMCCNYHPVNQGTTTRVEPGHGNPGKNNPGTTTRVPAVPQPGHGDAANPGTVTPQTRVEQVSEQENIPESVFLDGGDEPPSDLDPIAPEWMDQGQPETPAQDQKSIPVVIGGGGAGSDPRFEFFQGGDGTGGYDGSKEPTPDQEPSRKTRPQDKESPPSEFDFILDNGKTWTAPLALVDSIKKTYPKINIPEQFRKAALWLQTNPERRKTARGMPRFLSLWIERTSNRPQSDHASKSNGWGGMPLDRNGYPDVFKMWKEGIKIEGMEADWK